jgi:anti-sigma B factor antagonist
VTIKEQRRGKIGILSLRGSFVGRSDVSVFEQAIFGLLRDDILYVVLDLSPLKFIDSAGLGAMISAMVSVGRREGALKLAAVQGDVQRIVKNMNLDQVFELYDTVDQAEASFGKKARS